MRTTKKITVSAMVVALSALLLVIGAFVSVADLLMGVLTSVLVTFVFVEVGTPYQWLVWLATSLTVTFLPSGLAVGGMYLLIFGIYPILKAYIERAPRLFWWPIKLVYINAIITALFFISEKLLGVPFFETDVLYLKIGIWALMNVAFVAYDMFLAVMLRLYILKYQKLFRRFLK